MSSDGRLPTELEVAGLIRAAEAEGGHAAVLRKGDPERGTVLLFLASRGVMSVCLERFTDLDGRSQWRAIATTDLNESRKVAEFLAKRSRFDGDVWAIELDIPDPQRFIANNLPAG
jgi:hypothetical protein